RQIEKLLSRTALRRKETTLARSPRSSRRHDLRAPLGEPLLDAFGAYRQYRHNHLFRNERRAEPTFAVVFPQEARHDLVVRKRGARVTDIEDLNDAPEPHINNAQLHEVPLSIETEDILADIRHSDDALLFARGFHSRELIAIDGRDLEGHLLAGVGHALCQFVR